jgi:hypothetical protein
MQNKSNPAENYLIKKMEQISEKKEEDPKNKNCWSRKKQEIAEALNFLKDKHEKSSEILRD